MQRMESVRREDADGKARELLDQLHGKFGMVFNVARVMANSPAALGAYLSMSAALGEGVLPAGLREKIALLVSEENGCDYCLAAHTAIGRMVGLKMSEIDEARRGAAEDAKEGAVLALAGRLVAARGLATEDELSAARGAGLTDEEILEVVANVVQSIFTNYVNHVAATEIDFPEVGPVNSESNSSEQ